MSELLAQLHFLRPHWLWALLALPLLALWWRAQRRRASVWRRHVDPHLLPHLIEAGASRRGVGGLLLRLLAWTLAVLALAGPSWRQGETMLQQGGGALVIALDLSDAMLAGDLAPSRLLQARAKLATLLRERVDGDVALVAFSDDAYTVAPLTGDGANVAIFIDALAPDVMPVDGHRPARAIEAAMALLGQAGYADGDILLLSHGADDAAVEAAARAAAAGFRVSALGLGRPGGAAYRARDGSLRSSRLDAGALRRVAAAGGGAYAGLTVDDADLAALGVLAGDAASAGASRGGHGVAEWRDEGWWLLPPLMLLGLLAFRRGAAVAVLVACLLLPLPALQAAEPVAGTAWRRADQVEHGRMREGIEAYRAGRYDEAERQWRGLSGADAAYNRGNALARAGRYEDALQAYDEALHAQPGMEDAIANRAAVEAAMRRQPPPGGGGDRQRPDAENERPDDGGSGGGEDPSAQQPDAQPGEGRGESSDAPSEGTPADGTRDDAGGEGQESPSPQTPEDAQAQHEADEAQRRRMQEALEQDGTPADDEHDPEHPQTGADTEAEAEREQRQAGEAWLRRVPDDPGGLLRARFRLEHERRSGMRNPP